MHIKLKYKRGQSTVEYVLLVTAVVTVIIAFLVSPQSSFQNQMNTTLNAVTQDIGNLGSQLTSSHLPQAGQSQPPEINVDITSGTSASSGSGN